MKEEIPTHISEWIATRAGLKVQIPWSDCTESLSWSEQANCVSTRAKRTLGYIYCQFYRFCCGIALLKLHSSLVLPILDYNSLIWDPHILKDIRQLDSV